MEFIFILVSFLASVIGSICGIGGGVIIKPVLDVFHVYSAAAINFMSGIIVLSMSTYNIVRSRISGTGQIKKGVSAFLGLGAAVGGVLGTSLFSLIRRAAGGGNQIGAVQAAVLFLVTLGTLLYTVNKSKIRTHQVTGKALCCAIGLALGVISSFLGIGGGPINLVVLFFFFSMEIKEAAQNSLFIIFLSQLASLLYTLLRGSIPQVPGLLLAVMALCGVLGGVVGRLVNKKIADSAVSKLFIGLMAVILLICCYNFVSNLQ